MLKTASKTMRSRMLVALVAIATSLGLVTVVGGAQAAARIGGTQVGLEQFWINGCGMPKVKVRAWKRPGNYKTVIMLDGMRAQYDYSGWEINTNIQEMVRSGVNVVEPIGGPASFYTDWDAPSNFNGQQYRYTWNCAITRSLVHALDRRGYRVGRSRKYAIMGLSMGGNASLTIGAQNRHNFDAAGSLSGYNFLSAPGMRTMIRLAMLDVDPKPWNVDSMWPIWGLQWFQNDPMWNIGNMHGMKIFVGSGNGLFGRYNALPNVFDDLFQGSTLEFLAFTQAKAFQAAAALSGLPVMSYDAVGTHSWGYWQDMVWNAKSRGFFR
ncbi:diacylglycerol acyltransferase/mycolyltransferase Ag85C [Gordonia defluvii]|jgi:diacylglycerol O-acyltransferase/trehalose O-mycolyltransferase|uniref:Diacylglycerol acyltransferase/mycolyltransferase Ag85C n=1 Tax=Gordonia defluvii TaxID=283718 RepID=A0ABP6LD60_9ACTN|nr:alpha/beta hydrolase-fold protein [Gordonia sp. UBA5067]